MASEKGRRRASRRTFNKDEIGRGAAVCRAVKGKPSSGLSYSDSVALRNERTRPRSPAKIVWCSDAPKVSPGEAVEQNTKGKGPLCGPIPVPILFMAEVKMQSA